MSSEVRSNLFEITDPQRHLCSVYYYILDKPRMIIMVVDLLGDARRPFFLDFFGIEYFEGPLNWVGANFFIGTYEEKKDLASQYLVLPDTPDARYTLPFSTITPTELEEHITSFTLYKAKYTVK
ncbi:MAG: hypothetical protein L0332_27285 [Chloroflexi bacterium]|nr:hypothetical protein [Chloroflexota bacterium]MCI0644705.1 hypothetical protein [Chloroflexota bacterium]MCI0730403.1 hypothetical protein [Chloroflexota bacterium]